MAAEREDDHAPRDTSRVDSPRAGAADAEPADAEPADAEPADAEPADAEPTGTGSTRADRVIAGTTRVLLIGATVAVALMVVLPTVFVVLALTLATAVGDWTIPGAAVVAAAAAAGTVYGGVALVRRLDGSSQPTRSRRPRRPRHWPWSRP